MKNQRTIIIYQSQSQTKISSKMAGNFRIKIVEARWCEMHLTRTKCRLGSIAAIYSTSFIYLFAPTIPKGFEVWYGIVEGGGEQRFWETARKKIISHRQLRSIAWELISFWLFRGLSLNRDLRNTSWLNNNHKEYSIHLLTYTPVCCNFV